MTLRRTIARLLLVGSLTAAGLVSAAPPASASFHLMVISEVSDGTTIDPNADFVELQMYASGQNFIDGKQLRIYNSAGMIQTTVDIVGNVPNGESQRTILIGSSVGQDKFHVFTIPQSGAVCFTQPDSDPVDCVAWGTFTGSLPVGTPFPGGMPAEDSLQRKITAACPTFLEASDDTNNSADDFQAAAPTPRNNSATPTEVACPGGGGGAFTLSTLKTRVKGGRATIRGKVEQPAPGEQVKLTFFANGSPLRKLATKNATLNADSKFKKRFKVPSESTRCKVVVRFRGAKLGQKKFKC